MSDPTIRISTCRGTGCPECGRNVPYSGGLLPTLCGCRVCSSGCFSQHERRLLMEALRQRDTFAEAQKRDLNESAAMGPDPSRPPRCCAGAEVIR